MAKISLKKSIIRKRGMTEFHAKPRQKTLTEKIVAAAKKIKTQATSPQAKANQQKVYSTLKSVGKGLFDLGQRIAENQARMSREAREAEQKTTKRKKRNK